MVVYTGTYVVRGEVWCEGCEVASDTANPTIFGQCCLASGELLPGDSVASLIVCCEDGRLMGNNVPSVNIYINASNNEGVRFSALDPHDVGMYSHTYIHIAVSCASRLQTEAKLFNL